MNESRSILIYTGEGASDLCKGGWKREISDLIDPNYHVVEEFHAGYDAGFNRGNVGLIVIPGGHAITMMQPMELLSTKIMGAVNSRKAALLGSCAGTIVCSSNLRARNDIKSNFSKNTKISLNPLETRVPYYLPHSQSYQDPENVSAVEVEWPVPHDGRASHLFSLYHAFGPGFPTDQLEGDVKPLISYKTIGNIPPERAPAAAVLCGSKEQGTPLKLFTGVHPEISSADLSSNEFASVFNPSNRHHAEKLKSQLEMSEEIRIEVIRSWLSELNIKMRS